MHKEVMTEDGDRKIYLDDYELEFYEKHLPQSLVHETKDGENTVFIEIDEEMQKLAEDMSSELTIDLSDLIDDDDKDCLTPDAEEDLKDKKLYGKNEIMTLLQCGSQKALNFLKLLFQMQYAVKIGKSYIIKAEDFDRFIEDHKGQKIML